MIAADAARQAVRNLRRLSLISHDPNDVVRSVRIHALAQRAAIEELDPAAAAEANPGRRTLPGVAGHRGRHHLGAGVALADRSRSSTARSTEVRRPQLWQLLAEAPPRQTASDLDDLARCGRRAGFRGLAQDRTLRRGGGRLVEVPHRPQGGGHPIGQCGLLVERGAVAERRR